MAHPPRLFTPLTMKSLTLANRIAVAPMCQYSAVDGMPGIWHDQHYGSLSAGGAGLLVFEATGVTSEGRISPHDLGLWNDQQKDAYAQLIGRLRTFGTTKIGIQLAHAGRKGSSPRPGESGWSYWQPIAPSAVAFDTPYGIPRAMTEQDMDDVTAAFVTAALRAVAAGFDIIELHAAHGYLLHQFLSPLSNRRQDHFGGSLDNRMRFPLAVIKAVRDALPPEYPLGIRVSATDWLEDGLTLDESMVFAKAYAALGLDYVCVSSGAVVPSAPIPVGPGYQVKLAQAIRAALGGDQAPMAVRAVGMIADPVQAETILASGAADWVAIARGFLDDPRWVWRAAKHFNHEISYPKQYDRAAPKTWRV